MDAKIFEMCLTKRIDVKQEFKRNHDDNTQSDGTQDNTLRLSDRESERYTELAKRVVPVLKAIFVDSWNAQLTCFREAEISRALSKKAKELMMEKKAEETQMEIDTESSISAGKIKDLIADAVKKAVRKQEGEIQKLAATLKRSNQKNSHRGALLPTKQTQRAPSTKKKEGKPDGKSDPKKKKGNETSQGRKGNDSPKEKSKSKKQSGPSKSRPNSNSSRRPTSRR
jgi:hypothetical protein